MAVTTMDVIDMNEALLTAQGLRGSTLTRESYGSDGEGEREWVPRRRLVEDRMTMSDSERTIFNKLGDSSSPKNKPTYSQLGLRGKADKKGVMWKTGPTPSWYTPWRKRLFVLKGNFLYYFDAANSYDDPPALGAIFIKNAIIEKDSMPFASHVLTVSPIVKRRVNWEGDNESSIFYLKFKTEEDRLEWFDVLQKVSFGEVKN
jgi:hypothetical protein